jgi:RNA polymerase sigma factor (sigma-70 family)
MSTCWENLGPIDKGAGAFRTTHWSLILSAQPGSASAKDALAQLYSQYWYPVYVYIRRRGYNHHDAQDHAQDFFARFIERPPLRDVDRHKGRFRTFLLACVDNSLSNYRQKATALKRGGQQTILSWDDEDAEQRYRLEACDTLSPEQAFDRRWAFTVISNAIAALKSEYSRARKLHVFETLQVFLSQKAAESYAEPAAKLNMTEESVRVAVCRLRQRYGKLLRAEVAHTVSRPEDIKEELSYLASVLSRGQNAL